MIKKAAVVCSIALLSSEAASAASPADAVAGIGANAAGVIQITYCDAFGNPYCDGENITLNIGGLTATSSGTGCILGNSYGPIVYTLSSSAPGIGVSLATTTTHDLPDYTDEFTFPSLTWRLIGADGSVVNSGKICVGAPSAAAMAGGKSRFD